MRKTRPKTAMAMDLAQSGRLTRFNVVDIGIELH